ncbi:MAG TPA: pyruvate formate-lyase-activating protein [Ornithinibacter sp.]|nr:pyruvate formate-lyase-activating protein [Ornithinibacter sp.]
MSSDPREASVHSWDVSTGVDGPGTRFVLFLAGCPLRCLYCQNPDTWHMRDGRRMHLDDIMDEVGRYDRFLRVAHGGVTVSGGEPLLQSEFVTEFFGASRASGLTTALDTSGFLGVRADDALLAVTDLVLLDIKSFDPGTYHRLTGKEVGPTLDFARRLAGRGTTMWIRFVLVPGVTDDPDNVAGLADFIARLGPAVERVEILPFHRLGAHKYESLRLRFPLEDTPSPDAELIERTRSQFAERHLPVLSA